MQFAHPAAVSLLRQAKSMPTDNKAVILVNACDPANPFGPGINIPGWFGAEDALRINRLPGSWLAFRGGALLTIIEGNGARMRTSASPEEVRPALQQFLKLLLLPEHLRPFREIRIEHIDGNRPGESPLAETLRSFGFERGRDQTMFIDAYALRGIDNPPTSIFH